MRWLRLTRKIPLKAMKTMSRNVQKYSLLVIKVLLTFAFLAAGLAKLSGAETMVQTFDAVGLGQWFRYVTGLIEIGGAALLWLRGRQVFGAGLLLCTMIGAVLAHLFIIGPSAIPALVLGALAAIVVFAHRDQLTNR
ncbi:MAG: DoxX family protein [Maricaulis sp.]|nr:DoxX family protein [Maricaulis sp.]